MVQKDNRTQRIDQIKIISSLENIYISPLESCNLACKYCYTKKNTSTLSNQQILDFVDKYSSFIHKSYSLNLKSIILCGGEVFTLANLPNLVNELIQKDIFVTIITNGTIDRLDEIVKPVNCQILVSLDGPKEIHDFNRGSGNFEKSIQYIKHAQILGFPVGIMFLVTKDSYPFKDSFPSYLSKALTLQSSKALNITYLTDRKMSLTLDQCLDIKLHYPTFPAKNFGCFQLSLQSTGIITGCCESNKPLGKITDDPQIYVSKFIDSLKPCLSCPIYKKNILNLKSNLCGGCSDSSYLCGYPQELHQNSCQDIIHLFNKNKIISK
jgi:sulfatase maturation enzyme AslB (radical SAM superfamily)